MSGRAENGRIIIKVPSELLIPADALRLTLDGDRFVINPDPKRLSAAQIELGGRMIEIFNQQDKAARHREECPWIAYRPAPHLLDRLLESRTDSEYLSAKRVFWECSPKDEDTAVFLCDSFVGSRVLMHESREKQSSTTVFMPLIDCLNHDPRASDYLVSAPEEPLYCLQIANYQAPGGDSECFVNYGNYDCIDGFINYGFAGSQAGFVRSVPLSIPVGNGRKIVVRSTHGFTNTGALHPGLEDIRSFVPVGQSDEHGNLILSHLSIPDQRRPHALRRVLTAVLSAFLGQPPAAPAIKSEVLRVERQIVDTNTSFFSALMDEVSGDSAPAGLRDRIIAICRCQLSLLRSYEPGF